MTSREAPTHAPLSILISGSGIAGACLAFRLQEFIPICSNAVLERFPLHRHGGQALDSRSASIPIVSRTGLLDGVRNRMTTEAGLEFLHVDGPTRASFRASGNVGAQSEMSKFEALRGDLTKAYMDATNRWEHTTYVVDEM
jgi:2-polyprenyl-6-methoxyphenol hydroxylase-like FAD-dependent oxidoreductase